MNRQWIVIAVVLCAMAFVSACGKSVEEGPQSVPSVQPERLEVRELPTLYPTVTPLPSPTPANTRPPQPTSPPATEVAFEQLVVDIRYSIPVLGLERRIRGNVAGEIEVSDEAGGSSLTLKNRPGVILEMQQALPKAKIEALPSDCETCVQVEYELPLTEQAGEGWLQDVQLLASLENFTSLILGPHFPPGTIAGIRREATPYEVAHSAAITADGQVWSWTATEAEIGAPSDSDELSEPSPFDPDMIDWEWLPATIGQDCYQGGGRESLYLEGPDGPRIVEVRCPELFLPGQLMPAYLRLSTAANDRLEGSDVTPPELPMALEDMVIYRRADGNRLTMTADGHLSAVGEEGVQYTSTLSTTQVLSLTDALLESGLLQRGPSAILSQEASNVILLRADDGIYELVWSEGDESLDLLVGPWDRLLDEAFQGVSPEDEETPEPTATAAESDGS